MQAVGPCLPAAASCQLQGSWPAAMLEQWRCNKAPCSACFLRRQPTLRSALQLCWQPAQSASQNNE